MKTFWWVMVATTAANAILALSLCNEYACVGWVFAAVAFFTQALEGDDFRRGMEFFKEMAKKADK